VAGLICNIINLYVLVIIVRLLMSWVPPTGPGTYRTIFDGFVTVTEPVLGPVRALIPPMRMGMMALDISPILVIVGLSILQRIICGGSGGMF
jgi:YggT family protein